MSGRQMAAIGIALAALVPAGCAMTGAGLPEPAGPPLTLVSASGAAVGSVTLARDGSATIGVTGMAPGEHGLHLHDKGLCEGPAFASAGPHWNPGMKQHGRDNPSGAHRGDLPNLFVDVAGTGSLRVVLPAGFGDADGTALVIHAKPDDFRTDPSGASGDRVACAVIAPPR